MNRDEWLRDVLSADLNDSTKEFLLALFPLLKYDTSLRKQLLDEDSDVTNLEAAKNSKREVG